MANRLAKESSLYLRQHGDNPVDWYPWCEEAFEKAEEENKPVLLSIGYSSCHWCHVMSHESFGDKAIARILNKHFISIKVDREERPDLDRKHMLFVQATTGSGGWPLNVFLTPEKEAFFGGTYFPPKDMGRMPSFLKVLKIVIKSFKEKPREELGTQYRALTKRVERLMEAEKESADFEPDNLKTGYLSLKEGFDYVNGGFIGSPKFPQHTFTRFLLRYAKRFRDADAFSHAELSLRNIARGGVYDQVGGGLHRYSVDAYWRVPHFEKMLYDQTQFLLSLCDLYQASRDEWIYNYIDKTADFLVDRMYVGPGFASAMDADTDEGEGAFYVWKMSELEKILEPRDLKFMAFYFDASYEGNFEGGANVLSIPFDDEILIEKMGLTPDQFKDKLDAILKKLKRHRAMRDPPQLDQKMITSWNALSAAALLRVWEITGEQSCFDRAEEILEKLLEIAASKKITRLLDGGAPGFLDDYVYACRALLQGFLSSGKKKYLDASDKMVRMIIGGFYEEEKGALSYINTSLDVQMDDVYDHELPSATSEFIILLLEHHALLLKNEYHEMAQKLLAVHQKAWSSPSPGAAELLSAFDMFLGPQMVAVITDGKGYKEMLGVLKEGFHPNLIILNHDDNVDIELFKKKKPIKKRSTVYLCQGNTCREPATDPVRLAEMLEGPDQE